jgi:hypothetical protein
MRSLIVYLAIAALLWCPYDCALKAAAAQSFANWDRAGCCDNCRERQRASEAAMADCRAPGDDSSAPERPSEDGKACLCDGAVFDAASRFAVDTDLEISQLPWVADDLGLCSPVGCVQGLDCVGPPPRLEAGRSLRVSLGSLLL